MKPLMICRGHTGSVTLLYYRRSGSAGLPYSEAQNEQDPLLCRQNVSVIRAGRTACDAESSRARARQPVKAPETEPQIGLFDA